MFCSCNVSQGSFAEFQRVEINIPIFKSLTVHFPLQSFTVDFLSETSLQSETRNPENLFLSTLITHSKEDLN